jgi:hypothetical protein
MLVDSKGSPIGEIGKSQKPSTTGVNPSSMQRLYEIVQQSLKSYDGEAAISRLNTVQGKKIDLALSFWKQIYFQYSIEKRLLNGIEAYEMGDDKNPDAKCDKAPYIAMCNLMVLEALKMMGDQMPTTEKATLLPFSSEREKEISSFWKETFAPTEFQAEWAWKAVLAILAGDPVASSEVLENFREQLP